MSHAPERRLLVVLLAGLLVLAACSNDDGGDAASVPDEGAPEETVDGSDSGTGCVGTDVTGTTPGGGSFAGSSATAARIVDGAAYTLYIGDFDLTPDSFSMVRNPEVPGDGTMWLIAVTIFDAAEEDIVPIEAGEVVEAGRPFGELTFTATVFEGEVFSGNSTGAAGTVSLTAVGDTLCGSIDYADDEKSVRGTFEAPTKDV
jgi:hypothetical protein